jgi:hypothetical protein
MDAATLTRLRREKNRLKWGEQNWPDGTGPSVERNAARSAAQARVDAGMKAGSVTYFEILQEEFREVACEAEEHELLAELIDVAAVAQDWADSLLRRAQRNLDARRPKARKSPGRENKPAPQPGRTFA